MLVVKDIHTYYGESYALQGVSLEVKEGQIVALLGRNGMGKTTTIRSIIGFNPPRRGEVLYKEKNIAGKTALRDLARGHRPGAPGPSDLPLALRAREPHGQRPHPTASRTPGRSSGCTGCSPSSRRGPRTEGPS